MARKRKNGDGMLRLRSDGRWEARLVIGYTEKGKAITKNVTAKDKDDCIKKFEELKEKYEASKKGEVSPHMCFGDWLIFWYENYSKPRLRVGTRQKYENMIYKHIIPAIGKIPLDRLSQNDLQQFYMELKTDGRIRMREEHGPGLSDKSIRDCHARCRSALEKACEEKLIRQNPAEGCRLPSKTKRNLQVLTREEIQKLFIQAKEERYYELFLLEVSTGLRIGELTGLQWKDLNFDTCRLNIERQASRVDGKLFISEPKTKASIRTVILPKYVVEVLKSYKENSKSRWIFPSPVNEDEPIAASTCRKRLHKILDHAGCKDVRFHDLRHTFATTALSYGMDVKTLSSVIGHVSASTTLDIYSHITETMKKDAAQKIDAEIGGVTPCEEGFKPQAVKTRPPVATNFTAYKGKKRRDGTGSLRQISENLWEGRYVRTWPDGKRHPQNVYGKDREECTQKLKRLIEETDKKIDEMKEKGETEVIFPTAYTSKARIRDYMKEHMDETNKTTIAKATGTDRGTVRRYWEEIMEELRVG